MSGDGKENILSIGCGIGYIEHRLAQRLHNSNKNLVTIEPSKVASLWLENNSALNLIEGYFPECLTPGESYDFAYSSAIEYVFNDTEYHEFLVSIIEYGIKDFMVISVSFDNENIIEIFKDRLFYLLEKIGFTNLLHKTGLRKNKKFWG